MTIDELKRAADNNQPAAQNDLGICYMTGQNIKKDETEAVRYFRLASKLGSIEAQHNLGICYANGFGVKKDSKKAVDLLSVTAYQGNDEAISLIEHLCHNKKTEEYCNYKNYFFSKNTVLAYFDILGFSNFVNNNQTNKVVELYNKLIDIINRSPSDAPCVPTPLSKDFKHCVYVGGVLGDIHTFYSSDSFLIWMHVNQKIYKQNPYVPYWLRTGFNDENPLLIEVENEPIFYSNNLYYHAFLEVCMDFFCEALMHGIPLRGCVSTGNVYFNEKKRIYIGSPLVEAVRGESARQYIGVDFGASFAKYHPIFNKYFIPNKIQIRKNEEFSSPFSLDWARHWREKYKNDTCLEIINNIGINNMGHESYYHNTVTFYEFSKINNDWAKEINKSKFNNMNDYINHIKLWLKTQN